MKLGIIADDFTGASDIANTLARGGLATTQFMGIPRAQAAADCEAGVVALKTRSIPAADAIAQSLAAMTWLQAQGATQFVFKYCSTFDSTPEGNIGPVGEALAEALGARGVVACPAFPTAGRTVFQGHLFVGDRLLSESPLKDHPLNPMTDPDLRRWLRRQSKHDVGLVPHATVRQGGEAIASALKAAADRGEWLVIVDAVEDRDLMAIGAACRDAKLVTGGSGIAIGLAANLRDARSGAASRFAGVKGPAAVLAGSCSAMTLKQVAHHRERHPSMAITTNDLMEGRVRPSDAVDFILVNSGKAPLVFTSDAPAAVAQAQQRYGAAKLAHAIESFFGEVATTLARRGIRRLVVAGGETSGAVMVALGLAQLDLGPEIDPGVPVLHARDGGLALALKSGNFGAVDFFEKALHTMEGTP